MPGKKVSQKRSKQGFAALSKAERHRISSMGGKARWQDQGEDRKESDRGKSFSSSGGGVSDRRKSSNQNYATVR